MVVFLKGKLHSDAVRGAAAPERPGDVTCRGPGPPLLAVRRGPAQERPGNRETPGNIGRPRAGCPCGPPCGGVAASVAAAGCADGREGAAAGEPAGGMRGALFSLRRPFSALLGISCLGKKWARPRKTPVRAPESL